jgi:tripartite motif-containing protein 23
LDSEAENVRTSITNAVQQIKSFGEEVADSARKFGVTIQQIEGGVQLLQSPDGTTSTQRVG